MNESSKTLSMAARAMDFAAVMFAAQEAGLPEPIYAALSRSCPTINVQIGSHIGLTQWAIAVGGVIESVPAGPTMLHRTTGMFADTPVMAYFAAAAERGAA
jgi:hypothetical protein